MTNPKTYLLLLALLLGAADDAVCQSEVMGWGNLTGIRIDGQLMEFESSLCVVEPDWRTETCTTKEGQRSTYSRNAETRTVTVQLRPRVSDFAGPLPGWEISARETVRETGPGAAAIDVELTSKNEADIAGIYLRLTLPAAFYSGGRAEIVRPEPPSPSEVSLAPGNAEQKEYLRATSGGVRFLSQRRKLEVAFGEPSEIVIREDGREGSRDLQAYIALMPGKAAAGGTVRRNLSLKAEGEVDRNPVEIAVDASRPGRVFDGLGGNFRIQNPETDPAVIQYNLENLRVAWGRVELPWYMWHPVEETDPLDAARAGRLHATVDQAMAMARTLARRGMPVIVSAWFAPSWAILGKPSFAPQPGEPRGNALNPEKMTRIAESIAGYLVFLKEKYGVEASMFSFNESDLGINVRQTAREHAELIKTLGSHFASRGLATRMLLGDTSDAFPVDFIRPALEDPESVKYIGAVSFHSWRGCTDEILTQWHEASRRLNVPLLVGEGSTDAEAWNYPQIFAESSFALHEIDLYTRILAIGQPRSILQWQLTADYSILAGGGVSGDNGPLRPTQRFWNLKQLASTPAGAFALPVRCGGPGITCAAFGDITRGAYAIHIVNNGAARSAAISGLPEGLKSLRIWVTDTARGMQEGEPVPLREGQAQCTLEAASFTTLIGAP